MRILALAMALAIAACTNGAAQENRAAAGEANTQAATSTATVTRDYDLSGFRRVALSTPDNVEIQPGAEFAVRAQGPASILDELELRVEGDVLEIGYRHRESGQRWNRPSGAPATIFVTMPSLSGVSLAGSGDIDVGRFTAQSFEASIAGSGNIAIESLQTDDAAFDIAGSGDLSVAGTAGAIDLAIAGSGDVAASDFRAQSLDVDIAGSGDVSAYVTDTVQASFVGSGDVVVRGGAQCRSSAIGSGRLRCD